MREDVSVLNVVNFGGGSYVLYAEILEEEGEIEVDPEPYSDNFDRPARLLPVEAKALVAAIDLIGEHIPEGSLASAREKIVAALGEDPMEQGLQVAHGGGDDSERRARRSPRRSSSAGWSSSTTTRRTRTSSRTRTCRALRADQRPRGLVRGVLRSRQAGRCATSASIASGAPRSASERFEPRPEVDPAADVDGWLRTGEVQASRDRPRLDLARAGALGARARNVVEERNDGSIIVELSFAGIDWLVREVLKEAGDAAVLEPQDAREAVLSWRSARRSRGARSSPSPEMLFREPPRADQDERRRGGRVLGRSGRSYAPRSGPVAGRT